MTIDDPGAYARPFKVTFTAVLQPGDDLIEYICQENNQDVSHIQGPPAAPGAAGGAIELQGNDKVSLY